MLLVWNNFNVISAHTQTSQSFQWNNVNIQGMGYVTGMAISGAKPLRGNAPVKPYGIYVRTDVGGAYRFDRKNKKWLPLMDMFDSNFSGGGIGVESIAVDPQKSQNIYAAVNYKGSIITEGNTKKYKYSGEVIVSQDRGNTWKPTGLGKKDVFMEPNQKYRSDTGERLAVDPNNSDIVYFASRRDGLWKKIDKILKAKPFTITTVGRFTIVMMVELTGTKEHQVNYLHGKCVQQ